jgi:hypothetical protein
MVADDLGTKAILKGFNVHDLGGLHGWVFYLKKRKEIAS